MGHLMRKLSGRNPALYEKWRHESAPKCHSVFRVRHGGVEAWERPTEKSGTVARRLQQH